MTKNSSDCLTFACETLERRQMMAGNVSVRVTGGGDLVIDGDNANNEIGIAGSANGAYIRILGLNGTTINERFGTIANDVNDDVRINMRNGNNAVILLSSVGEGVSLPPIDDIRFRSRSGNDVFVISANIAGQLSVSTGDGNDTVVTEGVRSDGVNIRTGAGDDFVRLDSVVSTGRVTVSLASGNDSLGLSSIDASLEIRARMGSGNDIAGVVSAGPVSINGNGWADKLLYEAPAIGEIRSRGFEDPTEFQATDDLNELLFEFYAETPGGVRVDNLLQQLLAALGA